MPNQYSNLPKREPVHVIGPSIAYVSLTKGLHALIDSDDIAIVSGRNWLAKFAKNTGGYYAANWEKRDGGKQKFVQMHCLLLPCKQQVDHRNGNGLDNRRSCNLRSASAYEQSLNRGIRSDSQSRVKGVYFNKAMQKWHAYITVNKKRLHLGLHQEKASAVAARQSAEAQFHGSFSRT